MNCVVCEENRASVLLEEIGFDGKKQSYFLCSECSAHLEMSLLLDKVLMELFGKGTSLPFFDLLEDSDGAAHKCKYTCSECGLSFDEFKSRGTFGCATCYASFAKAVEPLLENTQGAVKHVGRVPKRGGATIKRTKQVDILRQHMNQAVADEDFSRAAFLRDQIKRLDSVADE